MEEVSSVESTSKSFSSDELPVVHAEDDDASSSDMEAIPNENSRSWMSCAVSDVEGVWLVVDFDDFGDEICFRFLTVVSSVGAFKAVW
eukprot:796575-Ditylum_brightwellii.AAC.1